jgi:putative sporulation protein YtaF
LSIFTSLILAIAVSIDGLSVGIIYGMKGIKVPWFSQLIIALATSTALMIAMCFGNVIMNFFNPVLARFLGALILFAMGIWSFWEASSKHTGKDIQETVATFKIKPLGLVITILKEPVIADADTSGVIDSKEAFLLGTALAMDAFGAGFGAAVAGFQLIWTTILVTVMSLLFLSAGLSIGRKKIWTGGGWAKYLPGGLLLALAVIKALKND